jgi:hypothetical protein
MDAIEVASWDAFQQKLRELREQYGTDSSPLLFRGQGNSKWELNTTLDRSTYWTVTDTPGQNAMYGMTLLDYYNLIAGGVGPEIKTFSGVDVPERKLETAKSFFERDLLYRFPSVFPDMQLYQYMAYLRHHGFPSPLLDWSRSPYVAAFFAFREDPPVKVETRSIYAFCKSPTGNVGGVFGKPSIYPLGPYVSTHHRHFRQRCDYTYCAAFDVNVEQWRFEPHQRVFDNPQRDMDLLWKFNIPSTERETVLRALNDYNLNAFSLFGSEESLVETLWVREYILREVRPKAPSKSA